MKKGKVSLKSATVSLQRVYQDKTFEGNENRWVLTSNEGVYYSYFGEWGERKKLKPGDKVKLFYTETERGGKVFRNVKDWKLLGKKQKEKLTPTDYQIRLNSLNKAIEIAKIMEKEKDILILAKKIKSFLVNEHD